MLDTILVVGQAKVYGLFGFRFSSDYQVNV